MNPPAVLKPLVRILKTADQIEKHDPVVAYCCRHYAVELGVELKGTNNDPSIMKFLSELLDIIEASKAQVDTITQSKETYVRDFASRVFEVAENEYQGGKATKNTARSFLHASVFFEALRQFAPLTDEINGRIRYSKWKATEIMTAISEGRAPVPDGHSEKQLEEEMNGAPSSDIPDGPSFGQMSYAASPMVTSPPTRHVQPPVGAGQKLGDSGDLDLPDVPVFSQSQLASQRAPQAPYTPPITYQPPPVAQQSAPVQQLPIVKPQDPAPVRATSSGFNNFISSKVVIPPKSASPASIDVILEATKFSKNAISALQFDDPETAIKNLKSALRVLTGQDC